MREREREREWQRENKREGKNLSAKHIKTPFLDVRLWETQCGVSAKTEQSVNASKIKGQAKNKQTTREDEWN